MGNGIVFNIMKYSIHDGPGIRTTVFLKGCPLKCIWCHNPESQAADPQLLFIENKCMSCGDCTKACPMGAISMKADIPITDYTKCNHCGACSNVCPTTAREIAGKWISQDQLQKEILKDTIFYEQSGGGVTFSGGEPFSQPDFLKEALIFCKSKGIHTAVDTCGYAAPEILLALSPYIDLFLYDIKLIDDQKHISYTEVSNKLVLENLRMLKENGHEVWARLPIIPGVNDAKEDIKQAGELLTSIDPGIPVCLLPYHNIAKEKYRRLQIDYQLKHLENVANESLQPVITLLENLGLQVMPL